MMEFTERLKKVLRIIGEEHSTMALFAELKDWSTEDLKLLLEDVDVYHDFAMEEIDKGWQEAAFNPMLFFDSAGSKELDKARDELRVMMFGMCSEICSIAIYYLTERGVVVE